MSASRGACRVNTQERTHSSLVAAQAVSIVENVGRVPGIILCPFYLPLLPHPKACRGRKITWPARAFQGSHGHRKGERGGLHASSVLQKRMLGKVFSGLLFSARGVLTFPQHLWQDVSEFRALLSLWER